MRREIVIKGAAAVLAAGALTLAVADNVRPWRRQQVEFLELERRQLAAELATSRARPDGESAELQAAMIAADEEIAGRADDVVRLERELGEFRAKLGEAQRRRDGLQYQLEQARYRERQSEGAPSAAAAADDDDDDDADADADAGDDAGDSPGSGDVEIARLEAELLETRAEIEGIREFVDNREGRLRDLRSESLEARERWHNHVAPIERLDERLRKLERGAWWRRLPVAGLFHPSIGVREVAPSALAGQRRVDRCVTCHLGAPRAGFEDENWPLVWRSHPRLDLFLGEASPHPYQQFGCTACHGGEGRATGFERAGHLPAAKRPPARPIFPRGLFETGCVRCHGDQVEERGAAVAGAGRRLIRQMGCRSCHRLPGSVADGSADVETVKAGPALGGIAVKTSPAWAFQWLAAPRAFRPATFMPHFFDLDAGDRERQVAEIRSIVVYLWESSRIAAFAEPPRGDAEAGRRLFEGIGCSACHLLDAEAVRDGSYPGYERLHGPNLARTGDKVAASWLYAWLRDPRIYRHDTPMPSLRLKEREAADLTAYLMSLRDPAWAAPEPPPMPGEIRDELVLSYLQRTATVEASQARLAGMTERERNLYLGERSLARYGCHGCHQIPGFGDAEPVAGGDLPVLGNRALRFLDGGHPGLGGADSVPSALPLPDYGLSRLESAALAVNLLGWQGASESRRDAGASGSVRERSAAAGRAVLARYGCRGCHRIEGRAAAGEDSASEPLGPDLTFEGTKVRSSWLFDYLRDPAGVSLRPWQAARMPTFHWTDAELDAVVRYFADRDGVELFTSVPRPATERDLAVGAAVFRTLQCNRCHRDSEGEMPVPQFAPAYELARHRLRPDWVVDWILDPHRWDPQTHMPSSFVSAPGNEPDASFLVASFATPLFRTDQERLLRVFDTEAELEAYFSDPRRVASALRDYVWSLGE